MFAMGVIDQDFMEGMSNLIEPARLRFTLEVEHSNGWG